MEDDEKSTDLVPQRDLTWDDAVLAATTKTIQVNVTLLSWYHEVGNIVAAVTSSEKDGPRSVKQFAEDIVAAGNGRIDMKIDTLYDAVHIARSYSREQIDAASAKGVALRNLLAMATKKVTQETRDRVLEEHLASGEPPEALKERMAEELSITSADEDRKKEKAKKPKDGATEMEPSTAVDRLQKIPDFLHVTLSKLKDMPGLTNLVCKESDEQAIRDAKEVVDAIAQSVDDFNVELNQYVDAMRASLEKVKEVWDVPKSSKKKRGA